MRSFKKPMLALCVIVMSIALVLSGCGNNNNNNASNKDSGNNKPAATNKDNATDTNSPANTDTATPASDLKPVKLRLVYPGAPQKDQQEVTDAINKYLKEKINATITIEPIQWGQWDNKVNLMIAAREKVDIMFTAQWSKYAVNVGKGAFMALNDDNGKHGNLLKEHGQDILNEMDDNIIKGSQIDGKNYAVPTLKEMASQGGVIYRTDIAKELGIEDQLSKVTTVDELIPILETVKEKKKGWTPLFLRDGDNFNAHYFANWDYLGDVTIDGVILKDKDDTKVESRFDMPKYKELLKSTREMYTKGLINKDAATTQLSTSDAMKSGKVFMVVMPLKPGKDAELAAAVSLTGNLKQIALNEKTTATSETAGSMLAISTTSENPERAMMFIDLLHTDKYLNNLLNFGIEGTHYTKTGDNTVEATDSTPNYTPGAAWMFGSQFLNYIWKGEPEDKWDQFKAFNNGSHYSKGLGFTFNVTPKIKTKVAAMVTVRKQYDPALDTGSVDPDKIVPEYEKKMKAQGLEDVIKEKQKQFDEFLAQQ